jgi:hypothetical protein
MVFASILHLGIGQPNGSSSRTETGQGATVPRCVGPRPPPSREADGNPAYPLPTRGTEKENKRIVRRSATPPASRSVDAAFTHLVPSWMAMRTGLCRNARAIRTLANIVGECRQTFRPLYDPQPHSHRTMMGRPRPLRRRLPAESDMRTSQDISYFQRATRYGQ